MSGLAVPQSIPACIALAALGGILEVFATAALAYPAARMLEGHEWSDLQLKGCLALNLFLQILASIAGNTVSTWFGPVAIVAPMFFAAQLLANLVVFWIVLGLEAFSREMQIGTYVIVVAVVMLLVNGPEGQDYGETTVSEIMAVPIALIWGWILFISMTISGGFVILTDLHKRPEPFRLVVLLVARASAFAMNLSSAKALVLPSNDFWICASVFLKIFSGAIYAKAIVVQSTAVQQKIFVPLNAALIIFINAVTGVLIWRDGDVVQSWVGYACVFLLMALGCGLLLGDVGLLQETAPETFRGAWGGRRQLLDNLKSFGHDKAMRSMDIGALSMSDDEFEEDDDEGSDDDEYEYEDDDDDPPAESAGSGATNRPSAGTEGTGAAHGMMHHQPQDGTTTTTTDGNMKRQPSSRSSNNTAGRVRFADNDDDEDVEGGPGPGGMQRQPSQMVVNRPPMKRHGSRKLKKKQQEAEKNKAAWAKLYGKAKAAPRLAYVNVSGTARVGWYSVTDFVVSSLEGAVPLTGGAANNNNNDEDEEEKKRKRQLRKERRKRHSQKKKRPNPAQKGWNKVKKVMGKNDDDSSAAASRTSTTATANNATEQRQQQQPPPPPQQQQQQQQYQDLEHGMRNSNHE